MARRSDGGSIFVTAGGAIVNTRSVAGRPVEPAARAKTKSPAARAPARLWRPRRAINAVRGGSTEPGCLRPHPRSTVESHVMAISRRGEEISRVSSLSQAFAHSRMRGACRQRPYRSITVLFRAEGISSSITSGTV
jgi:hypothetical protein